MPVIETGVQIAGGLPVIDTGLGRPLTWVGVPPDGVDEIQDVDDGDATAGDFQLDLAGYGTTVAIAFDDNAAAVKAALDALPGVTSTVTGTGTVADPFVCTFDAPGGDLPLMTIVNDTTTGGSGAGVTANTAGVAGAYANIIALGGLVKNLSNGQVYENQGTVAAPVYVRIDTI